MDTAKEEIRFFSSVLGYSGRCPPQHPNCPRMVPRCKRRVVAWAAHGGTGRLERLFPGDDKEIRHGKDYGAAAAGLGFQRDFAILNLTADAP